MTIPSANLIGRGRTAELFAWDGHQALKLFYAGWPSSAAEAEARLAKQVYESGLRVPAVGGTTKVDGRPGILYERVEGPAMLDSLPARPWKIVAFANLLAELHAEMHAHKAPELPSQRKHMLEQIRSTA